MDGTTTLRGLREPGPGADVAAVSPVPVQMWQYCTPASPGADVAAVSSTEDVGGGEPSPLQRPRAYVAGVSLVPEQM